MVNSRVSDDAKRFQGTSRRVRIYHATCAVRRCLRTRLRLVIRLRDCATVQLNGRASTATAMNGRVFRGCHVRVCYFQLGRSRHSQTRNKRFASHPVLTIRSPFSFMKLRLYLLYHFTDAFKSIINCTIDLLRFFFIS